VLPVAALADRLDDCFRSEVFGLNAASCPTATFCVVVGQSGVILTSADGGASWTFRRPGSDNDANLDGVSCASATFCVAVSQDGAVLQTSDGGLTWTLRKLNQYLSLAGVSCPSATICVAVGDQSLDGMVMTTTDGVRPGRRTHPGTTFWRCEIWPA